MVDRRTKVFRIIGKHPKERDETRERERGRERKRERDGLAVFSEF